MLHLILVAQRFTAAITGVFSVSALAAEVRLWYRRYFFRKLFNDAKNSPKLVPF